MSVHTCQCRCVPHVEDHCRNGEPDFPPEVIEKAARAIYDLNPDVQPWNGDPYHFTEANGHRKRLALKQARTVLAAVADPLRAEGWDSGKHSEHTPSCRWSNAPDCICVNPYHPETDESRQKGVTND